MKSSFIPMILILFALFLVAVETMIFVACDSNEDDETQQTVAFGDDDDDSTTDDDGDDDLTDDDDSSDDDDDSSDDDDDLSPDPDEKIPSDHDVSWDCYLCHDVHNLVFIAPAGCLDCHQVGTEEVTPSGPGIPQDLKHLKLTNPDCTGSACHGDMHSKGYQNNMCEVCHKCP